MFFSRRFAPQSTNVGSPSSTGNFGYSKNDSAIYLVLARSSLNTKNAIKIITIPDSLPEVRNIGTSSAGCTFRGELS
jgi:hypothetical protein